MRPKLVMGNIFPDPDQVKQFADKHGFDGVEWSFDLETLPATPAAESEWVKSLSVFAPLEVRYHCPFHQIDLGHEDPAEAEAANTLFRLIIRLVSKAEGKYLSIHIGLGRDTTEPLSWDETVDNLRRLVQFGLDQRVQICLENLAWGWTSRPNLFEKLIRKSGAGVTFDLGHAFECEAIRSRQYAIEDFVTPHADRVINAHIYHRELEDIGHKPPEWLVDIEERLAIVNSTGCEWWVLELRDAESLLHTKKIVESFLGQ